MDFICDAGDLLEKVEVCNEVTGSGTPADVSAYIQMTLAGDGLTLRARNSLGLSYRTSVKVCGKADGEAIVYAPKFMATLASLPGDEVRVESSGGQEIKVTSMQRNVRFSLRSLTSEAYPRWNDTAEPGWVCFDSKELRGMIAEVSYAVSQDISRLFMNGVYFEFGGNDVLTLVATDGRRLAYASCERPGREMGNAIVPTPALNLVRRHGPVEGHIRLAITDGMVFFGFGGDYLSSPVISGQYPAWRRVIPSEQKYSAAVDSARMRKAVQRAMTIIDKKAGRLFCRFDRRRLTVSTSASEIGGMSEEIECDYDGEPMEFAFNVDYIRQVLDVAGENLDIEFSDPLGQVTFNTRHIVMPMRVD